MRSLLAHDVRDVMVRVRARREGIGRRSGRLPTNELPLSQGELGVEFGIAAGALHGLCVARLHHHAGTLVADGLDLLLRELRALRFEERAERGHEHGHEGTDRTRLAPGRAEPPHAIW